MKQLVIYLSIFSVLLFSSSCTYRSSLQKNAFSDPCISKKIPMKIGVVASQSLKNSFTKASVRGFNFEVRVDETLQKSIYDLFACYYTQVTMLTDASKLEGLDALVYGDYSVNGHNTLLEIVLKDNKSNSVFANYKQAGVIDYHEPVWVTLVGGGTLFLAIPVLTQAVGSIYEEALFDNIVASVSKINAKMRVDRRVKGVKRFDTTKLKQGMSEAELKNYYGSTKETVLNDPFTSNVSYNVILFEALPSINSDKVDNAQPYTTWAMFQDNKAIAFGVGEEKDAEHSIYSALVNQKYALGKLKQSQAERMIYDNFRKLYGEPEPITKEMAMFRIMLAEKMETGNVLQSEADYLMAQKEAEVAERIKEIQRKEDQLLKEDAVRRELIELQQRQLANQQQANAIAQSHATSQALLGVANYINQQTYQQQLLQSLNKPFSMNCWSNGRYTNCQGQ